MAARFRQLGCLIDDPWRSKLNIFRESLCFLLLIFSIIINRRWRLLLTWASGFSASGLYYQGILDRNQLEEVSELHKRDTVSTFGTRSSFRVSSGVKAVKSLEKSTGEVLETEKENHGIQSCQLKNRLVRMYCSHGGDTIQSIDPPLNSHAMLMEFLTQRVQR